MFGIVLTAMLLGLPIFAVPAAAISFCLIVIGRRLAGVSGMTYAAIGSALLAIVPLALCLTALVEWLSFEGTRYPDQIKGMLLFGSMAFSAGLGVGTVLFFCWHDQWAKTR